MSPSTLINSSFFVIADSSFDCYFNGKGCGWILHGEIEKIGVYKKGFRNVKDEKGTWQRVDTFEYEDSMPYGHGEKSVYMIQPFMKLTREEAFAIRYHMGYSSTEDARNVSAAFEMFPLAFAVSVADSEATYFVETKK